MQQVDSTQASAVSSEENKSEVDGECATIHLKTQDIWNEKEETEAKNLCLSPPSAGFSAGQNLVRLNNAVD